MSSTFGRHDIERSAVRIRPAGPGERRDAVLLTIFVIPGGAVSARRAAGRRAASRRGVPAPGRAAGVAAAAALLLAAVPHVPGPAGDLHAQGMLTLGARGGVSVASASLDASETFAEENRTGFVGGAFLSLQPGLLGFQVEALYHEKGFREADGPRNLDVSYIEFPALLKLALPLPLVRPGVFGGPALAFEARCAFGGSECQEGGFDSESSDVGAVFGADVALGLGRLSLWADGRYTLGLSDIHGAGDVFQEVKNRSWDLTVGLGISP